MKNIIKTLLLCLLTVGTFAVQAQVELSEGYIKMEITEASSDDPQTAQALEMMKGTETEVYFKGGKSLTALNMMGGMVQMKNILNESGDLVMYMDMMGNKMEVTGTKLEMDKFKAENPNPMSDLDITYDESDTKEIAGYKCYKMMATSSENEDLKITAYITDQIKINAAVIQGVDLSEFKGFPLEYSMDMGGQMKLVVSTVDLKESIDTKVFDIDGSSYKKMNWEEFMSQMGGMGGGFGF